jgi:uncharacterized low-complexity protein
VEQNLRRDSNAQQRTGGNIMSKRRQALTAALGVAFMAGAAVAHSDGAFGVAPLSHGYALDTAFQQGEEGKDGEGKCGEGKCGEGSCGEEGSCGGAA